MNKTVFIDMETTHLDTMIAQPIQVALVAVNSQTLNEIESMEIKINFDELEADASALLRNGYDPLTWSQQAISSESALNRISDFFRRHSTWRRTSKAGNEYATCEIAGHNVAGYDAQILMRWYQDHNQFCPAAAWATGPVDTMHMARNLDWLRGKSPHANGYSLGALCKRYNIEIDNEHDAMCDVMATVNLARKLRGEIK